MASFYLDNDVSLRLVPLLVAVGHGVTDARSSGLTGATDDTQLLFAAREGRVLVTYDRRDFALLHDAWLTWTASFGLELPPHSGILAWQPVPVEQQFTALVELVGGRSSQALANEMLVSRQVRAAADLAVRRQSVHLRQTGLRAREHAVHQAFLTSPPALSSAA
jgi:predicted nuclease of predicted toxin-antitoxin system